jgi:hypothetical protein
MSPFEVSLLLGHADSRMVERIYSAMKAEDVGKRLGKALAKVTLPDVPVSAAGDKWVPDTGGRVRRKRAHETTEPPEVRQPTVPRAGVEPATRGFSVPCSTN